MTAQGFSAVNNGIVEEDAVACVNVLAANEVHHLNESDWTLIQCIPSGYQTIKK